MRRYAIPILAVLMSGATVFAQERTHRITPDDYFSLATILEVAVSPDGKRVAYTEARWEESDNLRKTNLWVVATDAKSPPVRLTGDRANDRVPKWSADGKSIFVLGNRRRAGEKEPPYDGSTQVWEVSLADKRVTPITRVEEGVTGFDYAIRADAIFYSRDKTIHDEDDFAKLRSQYKADYGSGIRTVSTIWKLDLKNWRTEKVVDESRFVKEFAVPPSGEKIAMISVLDNTVVKSEGESRVDVWEFGKVVTPNTEIYRAQAASPHAWLEGLAWNADGTRFAFCAVFDAYPAEIIIGEKQRIVWVMSRAKRQPGVHVRGYGSPLRWNSPTSIVYLGEDQGMVGIHGYETVTKDVTGAPHDDAVVSAFDVTPTGGGVTVESTATAFADIIIHGDDEDRKLTDVNPHTKTWKLPTIRHITWKAPDGTEVGGVLELPAEYKKGEALPLVVAIHGGPTTATKADLSFDPHNGRLYFAASGYAVLLPNYRGSVGYGDDFVTALIGHENDIEVKDIIAGVQHLVKEGIADPKRIGSMGWSNGGYLTNCLITRKDSPITIKAASSGGSIVDTIAEWGFNDEPAYPKVFKKGLPWETPKIYQQTSPTYGLGNVTAPTLIHVGENDPRCPAGHSRMLHRALKEYLHVPTELIVYPGEGHGLSKMSHRRAKMEWDLAWFEKYLKK